LRVLFWGTPAYALPSLERLLAAGHTIVGVVSQPDRRRGRGGALSPSAVKARALELGLPVFTPQRIRRDAAVQAELAALGADAYVVVAFGQILPPAVLDQPPLGCWNGHASLLPRWRGAAPIQWALIEGDRQTGVGIMAMEEGLDTGPVLLESRLEIGLLENARQLGERLARLTGELLVEALPRIEAAGAGPRRERLERLGVRPQGEEGVRIARLLRREDFRIDWSLPALQLHRRVMGLHPAAFTHWRGQRLKLHATEPLLEDCADQLTPAAAAWARRLAGQGKRRAEQGGVLLALEPGEGMVVACGEDALLIRAGQLEGRRPAAGQALLQQLAAQVGDRVAD
jgi:methionyl-tRNA formyltransferase